LQASQQAPASQSDSAAAAASGPRHGPTTITDPVQMMWQQQQFQPPVASQPPGPSPQGKSLLPQRGFPQLWPLPEQAAPAERAIAGPSRQQQHPQQQLSPAEPSQHELGPAQQQPSFQPFAHSLLPQLRTSGALPLAPTSSASLLGSLSPSQSPLSRHSSVHTSGSAVPTVLSQHPQGSLQYPVGTNLGFDSMPYHANGNTPGAVHHRPTAALAPHLSAPFSMPAQGQALNGPPQSPCSSARESFDGHQAPQEDGEGEALSTFHLPEGLAEQLSTSQPTPASAQGSPLPLPQSSTGQSWQQQQPPSPQPQQTQAADDKQQQQHPESGQVRRQPKLRSPPGFSRPLDGAAKPFVPGRALNPSDGSGMQQLQAMQAGSAWPQAASDQATRHMRPPPGMGGPASTAGRIQFAAMSPSPGQMYGPKASSTGKIQQHANLASGQWALANGINGTGQHIGSPFSQPLVSGDRPFLAEAQSSTSSTLQWQVPQSQAVQPSLQHDRDATACLFDTEQHETSGLAPNDVLDFLGIGSDDQHRSDTSQSMSDQHHSQMFS